jgi:periplasmic protein TonB
MAETVTTVILSRSREPEGLGAMLVWSALAHVVAVAVLVMTPLPRVQDEPRPVMTISLGGAPGPRTGGITQMGGRPVQAPPPDEPLPSRRAEAAPAAAQPAMTVPAPQPPPTRRPDPPPRPQQAPARRTPPAQPVQQAPLQATGRTPVTGEEPRPGSTPVETGVRGQGFGLSTGGGGGSGVELDVADFCCPDYLDQMIALIHRNWHQSHGVSGRVTVRFTIRRDGTVDAVRLARPSGYWALDNAAERAVHLTARLPPLPVQFTNPTLTVNLTFEYQR